MQEDRERKKVKGMQRVKEGERKKEGRGRGNDEVLEGGRGSVLLAL